MIMYTKQWYKNAAINAANKIIDFKIKTDFSRVSYNAIGEVS